MMERTSLPLPARIQRTLVVLLLGVALATWSVSIQTVFANNQQEKILKPNRPRTAFVYQGQLKESSSPANGAYDFRFTLHTSQTGGDELSSIVREATALTDGLFKVELDFGGAAPEGQESWLAVAVRPAGSADIYISLSPRQRLTSTPYAIFAQRGQWSLIGVPIGFAGGNDKEVVAAANNTNPAQSADSPENQATRSEGSNAALTSNGTPNFVAKFDGAGGLVNSIMFDDGARVGIGNQNPRSTLQVHGPGGLEQAPGGSFATASVFSSNFMLHQGFGQLGLYTSNPQGPDIGGQLVLGGQDGTTERRSFAAIAGRKENNISNNRDGYLQFSVRSNVGPPARDLQERMRITSAGSVGIGTTNPIRKLDVVENVDGVTSMGIRNPNPGSQATAVFAVNADGSQLSLFAHSSSYFHHLRANRVALVAERNSAGVDVVANQDHGEIRLFTGGYAASTERMRITDVGKIFIRSAGQGIVLRSPNGAVCRELTINNLGTLTVNAIACP